MNASCALQHFCDIHGAQILLFTEAQTYISNVNDNDDENLKTIYSQYVKSENSQERAQCKSCTLSSERILVSTIDSQNNTLYISSSSTPNKKLFKDVRNACVRSLHIEKSGDVDSPILFGDDENGYCLSLAFSCKDFNARGSQRLYSLCYLCDNKYHLLSLMKVLSECIKHVVYWLQHDANEIYEQEGRIKVNTNLNGTSTLTTYILRTPPSTPSQRMLSDVVHDPKLTFRIHALFVWLLRLSNSAIIESLFDALPTEEQTTKQERKDAFDDSSSNSLMKNRNTIVLSRSHSTQTQESLIISPTLTDSTQVQSILATSLYLPTESYHSNGNGSFDDDDFDSLQYQFSSFGQEALRLFQLFIKTLNNSKHLQFILQNWVIGNRLIIKYTNRTHNKDVIRALASVFRLLLPDGCFNLVEATNQITSCTANFVLYNTDLVLSDALSSIITNNNADNSIRIQMILDDIADDLRVVKLETLPSTKSELSLSTYAKKIFELLTDNHLNDEAFESLITLYKIKYLNKAKLYFQIGRCQMATSLLSNEHQQMAMLQVENINDLQMIRFWQKGLSQAYRTRIRMLKQDDNQQQKLKYQRQQQQQQQQ